jgi:hypothetical protein
MGAGREQILGDVDRNCLAMATSCARVLAFVARYCDGQRKANARGANLCRDPSPPPTKLSKVKGAGEFCHQVNAWRVECDFLHPAT